MQRPLGRNVFVLLARHQELQGIWGREAGSELGRGSTTSGRISEARVRLGFYLAGSRNHRGLAIWTEAHCDEGWML